MANLLEADASVEVSERRVGERGPGERESGGKGVVEQGRSDD
jgi:hypothetical protein